MTRRFALLLLAGLPMLAVAQEKKDEKKQKPSYLGVMIAAGKEKGTIVVLMAIKDSPAEKAGLLSGDVILKIEGAMPADLATAVKVIKALKPGKKAKLLIKRDGKEKEIEVVPAAVG
jgi:S1-C subfamily serine protease